MADSAVQRAPTASLRPDVFISYSRQDKAYVEQRLAAALEAHGKDVWLDVDDIRGGASDWRATVWAGIEASKVVVFVLSPDSLASRVCADELAHAGTLNKRIIPILLRPVDDVPVPDLLARPNWILARDEDDFDATVAALVTALETDEQWIELHARLTERTAEWLQEDRDRSYLLRGSDLRAAERWLDDRQAHAESPTADQVAYINEGRRAAARRQRLLLGGVALALGVSIALGVVAYVQRQSARSQAYAASAIDAARRDPEEGLRLALRAADLRHGDLVARALRETVAAAGWLRILRDDDRRALNDVAFSPDGSRAVTGGESDTASLWDVRSGRRIAALRHAGVVHSVQFSRDGRIVTAAADGTARVWDADGHPLRVLRPRAGRDVWSAVFDRRGQRIITGTDGGAAQVWNPSGRMPALRLQGGADDRLALTPFSPDGRRALTAGANGIVRLWTLGQRARSATLRPSRASGAESQATVATFSPDGRRALAGYASGTVCVWDLRPRERPGSCRHTQRQTITDADFAHDGRLFVTASADGTAVVRRTSGATFVATLAHDGVVNAARFDPTGDRIVTASDDRRAQIWTTGGVVERVLSGHTDAVTLARFSPDGGRVLTGSNDGSARVWPTRLGATSPAGPALRDADVAFSPDSTRLLAVDEDGHAAVWNRRTNARTELRGGMASGATGLSPCARFTGCAPWSADGRSIAGASASNEATIWAAGTNAARSLGIADASGAAFSRDGRRVAVVRSEPGAALVVDRGGGTPRPTIGAGSLLQSALFTANGRRLLTVTAEGAARLWNATTGASVGPRASAALASAVAVSPDGSLLAVGTRDGALQIHARGKTRSSPKLPRSITGVAFDNDGSHVVTISDDHVARIWQVDRLRDPQAVLAGHDGPLLSAEFSPDGRFVLTSSEDRTARVWDPALETAFLVLAKSKLGAARFSPDGRLIAISTERTVKVRPCDECGGIAALARLARARLPGG